MAKLPDIVDPTLAAMDAAIVERLKVEWRPRPYLGASMIGHACERRIWLSFRWVSVDVPDASGYRRIESGHRGEAAVAGWLKATPGVTLVTDRGDGKQLGFADIGGHVAGHYDGLISGLLQAPKTTHVWECKVCNDKKQAELTKAKVDFGEKRALKEWDNLYYAQAQLYMGYEGLTRHYLHVMSPGARDIVSCRTDFDEAEFTRLKAKAQRIVFAARPGAKISEKPSWYECRICPHHALCHEDGAPLMNCRTCMHSTPKPEGGWRCERRDIDLPEETQREGCSLHLYHPDLIPGDQVDAGEDWVEYQMRPDGAIWRNDATASTLRSTTTAQGAQP